MRKVLVLLALSLSPTLFAQTVTIGAMPQTGSTQFTYTPATFVDMSHPAATSAAINTATIRWYASGGTCTNAFKVKFLHFNTNGTAFVAEERGPFSATRGDVTVQISPPVTVNPGDMIGVTVLQSLDTCGTVQFSASEPSQRVWIQQSDIGASGNFSTGSFSWGLTMGAIGKSATEYLAGVVPAAGATQGVGAFFRTAMQLTNGDAATNAIGRLVYHPQGRAASSNDASVSFNLAPGASIAYPDVVTQMGQTGLGSMDVMISQGPLPTVTTRVFSDNGVAGTLGFTEDTFAPEQVLHLAQIAYLTLPADPVNFRMNIGVRTLGDGATIYVTYNDAGGHTLATSDAKVYPANYFVQVSAADFIGSSNLVANGSIQLYVTAGSAIVYASTTDNRTQDSSIKFAGR
ncbi:MAG TPA: hypothetical protein VH087_12380 [Thermoanaerobaculia bacterium]|nr:hypothetical protein [Thermoanaerobaculia bacterium]